MGYVATTRAQVKATEGGANVVPDAAQVPAAHVDMLGIANAIERKLVMRVTNVAAATSLNPPEEGMVIATTSSPQEIYRYTSGAWKKVWPQIYSGTTAPAAGLGADGDIYVMY
jgi:hypothetical protein